MTDQAPAPAPVLAALAGLGLGDGDLTSWARVSGGLANVTWRAVLRSGDVLAVQVPGEGVRTMGIDRSASLGLCRAASLAGVTPEVLLVSGGTLVQRWAAPARSPAAAPEEAVVDVLRRLHALAFPLPDRSLEGWVDRYRSDLAAAGISVGDVLGEASASAVEASVTSLRADPRPSATCHNDLVPENVLLTDRGVYLIDFEWAGAVEPLADVAGFWAYGGGDLAGLDALVDRYLGARNDGERLRARRLALLRHAVDALWRALRGEDPSASVSAASMLADVVPS